MAEDACSRPSAKKSSSFEASAATSSKSVVEKDCARVAELSERIIKLNENLRRIAPLEVKIAPPTGGNVNLAEELKEELASISVPDPDRQVTEALDQLRAGTAEGLTARDRTDLGVAYMNMGLVDDAVREFNKAKESEKEEAAAAKKAGAPPKKQPKSDAGPTVKISPDPKQAQATAPSKKAAPKKAAPKKAAPRAGSKKLGAKTAAAKSAASKKQASKKASKGKPRAR